MRNTENKKYPRPEVLDPKQKNTPKMPEGCSFRVFSRHFRAIYLSWFQMSAQGWYLFRLFRGIFGSSHLGSLRLGCSRFGLEGISILGTSKCEPLLIGEKLEDSLLKGSFDKACALTCRFLCLSPHPPTPSPLFPYFPQAIPLNLFSARMATAIRKSYWAWVAD